MWRGAKVSPVSSFSRLSTRYLSISCSVTEMRRATFRRITRWTMSCSRSRFRTPSMVRPWDLMISSNSLSSLALSFFMMSATFSASSASSITTLSRSACWSWMRFSIRVWSRRARSAFRASPSVICSRVSAR